MTQYKVTWQHNNNSGIKRQSSSLCTIELGDRIISARSMVHPNDNFDRKVGIYESFKKAAAKIEDKIEKKAVWQEFLSQRTPKTSKTRTK